MRHIPLTLLVGLTLIACDDPLYGVPVDGLPAVENPTYEEHIVPIWSRSCGAGCHTEGTASGGLDLSQPLDALLGTDAVAVPGIPIVTPGEPEESYLWLKVEGRQDEVGGAGSAMPLGRALSDADAETLENWILNGAPE